MDINWKKFWREQLPSAFRKNKIVVLIEVLCSVIREAYDEWQTWAARAKERAAYTWQVYSLERMVWLEMGLVIEIEESKTVAYNFLVNVSRSSGQEYDESRLRALLDRYKLAGKSYYISDTAISRTVKFIGHVCERGVSGYAVKFINHVCEKGGKQTNNISIYIIHTTTDGAKVIATSEFPNRSDLRIDVLLSDDKRCVINMRAYSSKGEVIVSSSATACLEFSITPEEDSDYIYIKGISN